MYSMMHETHKYVAVPVHAEMVKKQLKLAPCRTFWLWLAMTPLQLRSGTCRCCLRICMIQHLVGYSNTVCA